MAADEAGGGDALRGLLGGEDGLQRAQHGDGEVAVIGEGDLGIKAALLQLLLMPGLGELLRMSSGGIGGVVGNKRRRGRRDDEL